MEKKYDKVLEGKYEENYRGEVWQSEKPGKEEKEHHNHRRGYFLKKGSTRTRKNTIETR